ncbi:hypothetical protein DL98DRAFT_553763 [Cadophora sp. DSE1049]|nr:hypothetical protein DL98DRAFT_553763 [Cadophora sp. DSE1049]
MIGTTIWDFIFIRSCIFFLQSIAPLSILYWLTVSLVRPTPFRVPWVLEAWVAFEVVFYFLRYHKNIPDPESYLSKWVLNAPASEIKRENGEPDPLDNKELEDYMGEMEKLLRRRLKARRGSAKYLRLTLDKVDTYHRSLTWYLHRPHTSKTKLPILFIHSIGIRLYPYVNFLAELNVGNETDKLDGQLGIIAVKIMPISFRITEKFVLVSYSYRSVISAHLLHTLQIAQNVRPILFIDPVYRKLNRANEHQLHYFASKDIGDLIVNTAVIWAYLTGTDIKSWETESWKEELDHGQIFNRKETRGRLIDVVRRYCASYS